MLRLGNCKASDASSEAGVDPRGEGERKSLISGVGFSDGPALQNGERLSAEPEKTRLAR